MVVWVLQVVPPDEKNITWTARGGRNESRAAEIQVTKQRVQMTSSKLPGSLTSLGEGSSLKGIENSGGGIGATNWTGGSGIPSGGDNRIFRMIPEDIRKRYSKTDRLGRL